MNEFTKEDLQYLRDRIYERPNTITKNMDNMRNKIQYMIDNYCEHKRTTEDSALIQCCLDCNWSGFKS